MDSMMGSPNPDANKQASDSKKNQQSKSSQGQPGQQATGFLFLNKC